MQSKQLSGIELVLIAALLSVFFAVTALSSRSLSPCYDEPIHLRGGMAMLTFAKYVDVEKAWWTEFDPMLPPSDIIPAAFALLGGASPDFRTERNPAFTYFLWARLANHLLGVAALIIVFCWARRIWGFRAGFAAAALLAFNPAFIAQSSIVGTDIAMTVSGLLLAYWCWSAFLSRESAERGGRFFLDCGVAGLLLGLAISSKVANIFFAAIIPACILIALVNRERERGAGRLIARWVFGSAIVVVIGLVLGAFNYEWTHVAVNKTLFPDWPVPFRFGEKLANVIAIAKGLHLVLPPLYFNHGFEKGAAKHFAAFYLLRMPFALIALHVLVLFETARALRRKALRTAVGYLAALCFGLLAVYVTAGFYGGMRHLLFPFALFAVLGGSLGEYFRQDSRRMRAVVSVLGALTAAEVLASTPWQMGYANQVGRRLLSVRAEADWGQGLIALRDFQREHAPNDELWLSYFGNNRPEDFGVRYRGLLAGFTLQQFDGEHARGKSPGKIDGIVAISANSMTGRYMSWIKEPQDYFKDWLGRKPDVVLAGSILVFDCREGRCSLSSHPERSEGPLR